MRVAAGASADKHRRSPGKQWHFLPQVFVLVSEPGASAEGPSLEPRVYTLKEQKGFYDLGMGFTSPAFAHSLVVFAEAADALRYAGLLEALAAIVGQRRAELEKLSSPDAARREISILERNCESRHRR